MPTTTLTIDGTPYDPAARADLGLVIDALTITFDGSDELEFSIWGCGPEPTITTGMPVSLDVDGAAKFVGDVDVQGRGATDAGWFFSCRASGLKRRADRVTITGPDGTGDATYNRSPTDLLYVPSDAGLTVGQIITRLLTVAENATRLNALGIGAYTTLTPPTLPAATVSDLAALDIVPPRQVSFSGIGILNHVEQELLHWHPKYAMWIQPNGTIRFINLFAMPRKVLKVPTEYDAGDDVEPPALTRSVDGCYTAVKFIGVNIQAAILSVVDGTLDANWTSTEQSNWKYVDFAQPGDATSDGAVVSVTSTSATLDPTDNARTYAANSLSARQAVVQLINTAGAGLAIQESKYVTANTALSAGGTFTVNWSSDTPLDASSFNKYRLTMNAGGLIDVWRSYVVKEPASGLKGLNTFVGSHLMPRFPRGYAWANNGKVETLTTAAGKVLWSSTGNAPYFEWPMAVEIDRNIGGVRFAEPAVKPTVPGGIAYLKSTGSPTSFATGLPADIQVVVPYNRGGLEARKPAGTGTYEGTAYTEDGIARELPIHVDDWEWQGDMPDMLKLAQEHLDTVKDAVTTGTIAMRDTPAGWDCFTLGYALDIVIPGPASSELIRYDNLPVRSVTISWSKPGYLRHVTFAFSNLRRPFEGDDLYTHPSFGGASALEMSGYGFDEWNSSVGTMSDMTAIGPRSAQSVSNDMIGPGMPWSLPDVTAGLPTSPPPSKAASAPTPPMGGMMTGGWDAMSPAGNTTALAAAGAPAEPVGPMGDMMVGGWDQMRGAFAPSPAPQPEPPPVAMQDDPADTLKRRRGL